MDFEDKHGVEGLASEERVTTPGAVSRFRCAIPGTGQRTYEPTTHWEDPTYDTLGVVKHRNRKWH